ncbi:MAG: CDP-alcohol phosphatidyltransferase family protein [Candidatus Cyclobacteriaceae bacterium M2_1C_046]
MLILLIFFYIRSYFWGIIHTAVEVCQEFFEQAAALATPVVFLEKADGYSVSNHLQQDQNNTKISYVVVTPMLKNLTLAEWLAFFRIITFPVVIALVFILEKNVFAWTYLILFSTDVWDGLAGKLMKNDSTRREVLDTWGDNLYMVAGTVAFYHYETEFFNQYIEVILIVYGIYILELVMSLIKFGKPSNFHNYLAKAAAASQFLFMAHLLFFDPNFFLMVVAFFFSCLDVLDEIIILIKLKKWRTHIDGFWKA